MQINSKHYSTWAASVFSRLVSLVVFFSLAFCVVGGSEGSQQTQYAYVRYCVRGNNQMTANTGPIIARYYRIVGGASFPPVLEMFPFLQGLTAYSSSGYTWYFETKYTSSNWPWSYAYTSSYANGPNVPDTMKDIDIKALNDYLASLPLDERGAINGFTAENIGGETNRVTFTYKQLGAKVGDSIVLNDSSGTPRLMRPDSDGYIHGYQPNGLGVETEVWYHYVDGNFVQMSASQTTDRVPLTYDDQTGQYVFNAPDYSPQLGSIQRSIDNIKFTFPSDFAFSPNVTVNPEITVEPPEVTVTPQVTVNPSVTVNPTVTVSPDVTVNVDQDYSEIVDTLDQLVESQYTGQLTNDFSNMNLTAEEQSLLDTATGWETQIPVVGEAFDIGLNILVGRIPQMGKSYNLLNCELWGYQVNCDLSAYRETIMLFRAFFLLCELVWFFWVLWHDIMNALKV